MTRIVTAKPRVLWYVASNPSNMIVWHAIQDRIALAGAYSELPVKEWHAACRPQLFVNRLSGALTYPGLQASSGIVSDLASIGIRPRWSQVQTFS